MLVLIQFNEVTIFEGISKASVQFVETHFENINKYAQTSIYARHFAALHTPIISLKVALQSLRNSILSKPVSSFAVIFSLSHRNFISTVRLSKVFTLWLSKDLPEDFHKSHNTRIFSKLTV